LAFESPQPGARLPVSPLARHVLSSCQSDQAVDFFSKGIMLTNVEGEVCSHFFIVLEGEFTISGRGTTQTVKRTGSFGTLGTNAVLPTEE